MFHNVPEDFFQVQMLNQCHLVYQQITKDKRMVNGWKFFIFFFLMFKSCLNSVYVTNMKLYVFQFNVRL